MRFATYQTDQGPQLAVVHAGALHAVPGHDMLSLLAAGDAGLAVAAEAVKTGPGVSLDSADLLAPIPNPRRNVFCVGLNYFAHGEEGAAARGQKFVPPAQPLFFTKATTAVNGPYADVPFDAAVSEQIDWEVELAFVIGRGGKNITAAQAMDHVFGYTVVNDISARDLQSSHGGQFFKGKSLDGTCPMGPWIVTRDEIPDPNVLRAQCRVNGVTKQDSTTAEFIFKIPQLVEWLSRGLTLLPGDVIATGTPSGVGFARTPPEFLKPGDIVECEVEGIGVIRNRVVAA